MNDIESVKKLFGSNVDRFKYHITILQHDIYLYGYDVVEAFASVYFCELSKISATH